MLASCGAPTPSISSNASVEPASSGTSAAPIFSDTYTDVASINLESGDYMVGDNIFSFDKENKKVKVANYPDYDSYKAKQGTVVYDGSVRFVKVTSMFLGNIEGAAYFEVEGIVHLLYLNSSGKLVLSRTSGGSWLTSSAVAVSDIPLFSMGNYVSDKQSQSKADDQGNYIYDSQGNSIKEEFYLFLELSATKASVFVSDNATTHGETPLHSVDDYKVLFVAGKLHIKIPHKGGDFACTLTSYSDTEIKFTNSMERKGDYSCSGTFTKIAK